MNQNSWRIPKVQPYLDNKNGIEESILWIGYKTLIMFDTTIVIKKDA